MMSRDARTATSMPQKRRIRPTIEFVCRMMRALRVIDADHEDSLQPEALRRAKFDLCAAGEEHKGDDAVASQLWAALHGVVLQRCMLLARRQQADLQAATTTTDTEIERGSEGYGGWRMYDEDMLLVAGADRRLSGDLKNRSSRRHASSDPVPLLDHNVNIFEAWKERHSDARARDFVRYHMRLWKYCGTGSYTRKWLYCFEERIRDPRQLQDCLPGTRELLLALHWLLSRPDSNCFVLYLIVLRQRAERSAMLPPYVRDVRPLWRRVFGGGQKPGGRLNNRSISHASESTGDDAHGTNVQHEKRGTVQLMCNKALSAHGSLVMKMRVLRILVQQRTALFEQLAEDQMRNTGKDRPKRHVLSPYELELLSDRDEMQTCAREMRQWLDDASDAEKVWEHEQLWHTWMEGVDALHIAALYAKAEEEEEKSSGGSADDFESDCYDDTCIVPIIYNAAILSWLRTGSTPTCSSNDMEDSLASAARLHACEDVRVLAHSPPGVLDDDCTPRTPRRLELVVRQRGDVRKEHIQMYQRMLTSIREQDDRFHAYRSLP